MKNMRFARLLCGVLISGLLASCMGMEDTTPSDVHFPEVKTFKVESLGELDYVLSATVAKEDVAKISRCGFYLSEKKSMQNAEKIDSKILGEEFSAEISLPVEGDIYYACAYLIIASTDVEVCSEVESIVAGEATPEPGQSNDLSASGSANCYIVSAGGTYSFSAVKGNSSESVGNVKSVEVLWESFGTSVTPKVGDLVESVSYVDGSIIFQTSGTFREGNAVIAARGAYDEILWSWHIWLTDEPGVCYYRNVDGAMMDRNLGATSATPGEAGALGLLYQWGRKDPFLGSSSISSDVEAKSTISWPSPVSSSSSRGTIGYAVEHPTTFITLNDSNYDWYYTGSSSTDNTRWQSEKTIYDPCPAGWRVPDGGSNGVWSKAGFDDQGYDSSNASMLFGSGISSPATWYPASGYRLNIDGSLYGVGNNGFYWSVTPNGYYAYSLNFFYFGYDGYVTPTDSYYRAYGQSVRCLQE